MASSYMPLAASGESSRNGEPGSIRVITRSRGNSLPRLTWRSRARSEPPKAASARRACSSDTSARMRSALARKSAAFLSIDDERIAKGASPQRQSCLDGTGNAMATASGCHCVTFGTDGSNQTFAQEVSTMSGNSGGIQRRNPVRKAKLLSTVAFALLFGAGAAAAQGMSKDTPERAPAAQQSAPAEKVAPSMKNGEQKAPQTTGQATPDAKSGKAKETTGQAPSDKSDKAKETTGQTPKSEKSDMGQRSPSGAPQESSPANGGVNNKSNIDNSPAASPSTKSSSEENRATTGQGAAGSAKLTTEQRTKIS